MKNRKQNKVKNLANDPLNKAYTVIVVKYF